MKEKGGAAVLRAYFSDHMGAYPLLALALRETWGLAALPPMERTARGKPFFPGCPTHYFNISHSGSFALCAVGDEPVGADVETVRPRSEGLPRYALTPAELARFAAMGGSWEDFYTLWTAREAWSKFTGDGVARARHADIPKALCLSPFAGDGWRAAVCAAGTVKELFRR